MMASLATLKEMRRALPLIYRQSLQSSQKTTPGAAGVNSLSFRRQYAQITQRQFVCNQARIHDNNIQALNESVWNTQQKRSLVVVSQYKASESVEETKKPSFPPGTSTENQQVKTSPAPSLPINNSLFPMEQEESVPHPLMADNYLIITDSCWNHMEKLATKKGHDLNKVYLRVFVDAGGCSGFTYQFEYHCTDEDKEDDTIDAEKEDMVWVGPSGARVVVDSASMGFLRGATLDYVVEMIKSSFEVKDNPQSESACGCGSSFALKNFSANPAID